jgi:hypothetical protein
MWKKKLFILMWYSSILAGTEKYKINTELNYIKLKYYSMYTNLIPINRNLG